ncbi:unnamed protein product [Enterobius vermicularis]|uniref:Elongation factor Ts, mitochondrial n=1 Tax=Enterobius vermicularis TaxID=51028 RepID=A0A0N4UWX9_ENTVE|nr:unnamed protein product [Enterobius vermicularis]
MLRLNTVLRCIPASSFLLSAASVATEPMKIDKAALKQLRSRTGFSYVNCRKALLQFGSDRLDEAEKWMREMAVKEGWDKATKLKSRQTKQGLVSAISDGNRAALVEVYCETDFVARGDPFKSLVEKVAHAAIKSAETFDPLPEEKISLIYKDFDSLNLVDGTPAKDALRGTINEVGENIVVPPVTLVLSQPDVSLWSYAHPPGVIGNVYMGTFASVVGLEKERDDSVPIDKLGRQLCQQIIGMRAEKVGLPPEPNGDKSDSEDNETKAKLSEDEEEEVTHIDEKETSLLRQSFMLDPSQTVFDYITGHGVKVVDFYRVEVGEKANSKAA